MGAIVGIQLSLFIKNGGPVNDLDRKALGNF